MTDVPSTVPSDSLLVGVRRALADRSGVREVRMFGGVSFMVDDAMVVSVRGDGDLLVRLDPDRADEMIAAGARPAQMAGRSMGPSWMTVDHASAHAALSVWIERTLAYRDRG